MTRSRSQRSEFCACLLALGADVHEFPTIEIRSVEDYGALDRAIERIDRYDWLILTSQNAVSAFFDRLQHHGFDARILSGARCAVVGDVTAESLAAHGIRADLIPERHTADGLLSMIAECGIDLKSVKILFPWSDLSRPLLPNGLRERGAEVDRVVAYRTVEPSYSDEDITTLFSPLPDLVTFTSSSTVSNLLTILGKVKREDLISKIPAASIGPITTETALKAGLDVRVESKEASVDALACAIRDYFESEEIT